MWKIDLTTENKKKEVYELFNSFTKKGDIFKYYGVSDNTTNTRYLKQIGEEIGFDFSIYTKRKHSSKHCLNCGKELRNGQNKFCSSSCSATYNNKKRGSRSQETKERISNSQKQYLISQGKIPNKIKIIKCECCGNEFETKKSNQRFCCRECAVTYRVNEANKTRGLFLIYKSQTTFKFAINQYPEEFDTKIINEYGWYSASNRGNNLSGVSRDHMFSVNEGFRLKVDPYYISHPANCELMLQNNNSSKCSDCSITLDDLIKRVEEWNKKHGVYENKINYEYLNEFRS